MDRIFMAALLMTSTSLATATEWCPKHHGKNPSAVVDLRDHKLFYFTDGPLYNEDEQPATVYLTINKTVLDISTSVGISDWFTSTEYKGERNAFSCDSITLKFEYAWFLDKNETRQYFSRGEVRVPGHKNYDLVCE